MKKAYIVLLLTSIAGLAVSILMTKMSYQMGAMGLDEKSFCHVSDLLDCDSAMASRYAKIGYFLNSEIGILYYFLVLAGVLYAWLAEDGRATLSYLFVSSIFAVGYSVVMAYISLHKLGVLCLLCLTTYIANLILMVVFPLVLRVRYRDIPGMLARYVRSVFVSEEKMKPRLGTHLGATVVLVGLGFIFFKGLNPKIHEAQAQVPQGVYLKAFYSQPKVEIDVSGHPFWGNKDAKVTIVEFSDFQCPFCRRAAFTLKPYLKEFRNDVRFVFFNFPLDAACNPAIDHSMHPVSCTAAKAVLCADRQGKFWELHDEAFENQKRLSRSALLELGAKAGLNATALDKCLSSDEILEVLKRDVDEGNRLGVRGTPTVYVNGRLFPDWPDSERLRMVIESAIASSF